jgi:hypothetical protein
MGADGGVEAEAAAGLPGEHVFDGVLVEQAAALEEAEHTALQLALEAEDVVGRHMGRLVEGDAAVVALVKDAVEDDDVEVEVGIQGGPAESRYRRLRRLRHVPEQHRVLRASRTRPHVGRPIRQGQLPVPAID